MTADKPGGYTYCYEFWSRTLVIQSHPVCKLPSLGTATGLLFLGISSLTLCGLLQIRVSLPILAMGQAWGGGNPARSLASRTLTLDGEAIVTFPLQGWHRRDTHSVHLDPYSFSRFCPSTLSVGSLNYGVAFQ
jgi:hypothetical protein